MTRFFLLLPLLLSGCFDITTTRGPDGAVRSISYGVDGCPSGWHATPYGCYNPHNEHNKPVR